MCIGYLILRHLVDPKYHLLSHSWIMVFSRESGSPKTTTILPFMVIPWKYTDWVVMPTQAGPCFWGYTRVPRCLMNAVKSKIYQNVRWDKKLKRTLYDIYTRDWPSELIDQCGQIDCADIFIPDFFPAFSVICEIIIVLIWDESSWLEINYLRNGHWEIEKGDTVLLLEFVRVHQSSEKKDAK